MNSLPRPSIQASALMWVVASSMVALLLWLPAPSFARDAKDGTQTEQGKSHTAGVLSRGDGFGTGHGSTAVRRLQVRLRTLGFKPGPIDGLFGPRTHEAVQRFQRAHALVADGVVGPQTKKPLLARATDRKSRPSGASRATERKSRPSGAGRRERAAHDRAAPERPTLAAARPPQTVPATGAAPEVVQASGLAPGVAAGLGSLVTALLLGGLWMLGRRRRGGGTAAGYRAEPSRPPGTGLRLGLACAALLAVLALGVAAGALFTQQATSGERETKEAAGTAAVLEPIGADGAGVSGQRGQQRSPGSP